MVSVMTTIRWERRAAFVELEQEDRRRGGLDLLRKGLLLVGEVVSKSVEDGDDLCARDINSSQQTEQILVLKETKFVTKDHTIIPHAIDMICHSSVLLQRILGEGVLDLRGEDGLVFVDIPDGNDINL